VTLKIITDSKLKDKNTTNNDFCSMKQIYNMLLLKTAQQWIVDLNDSLCLYLYRAEIIKMYAR
jgi:hypothetical protein